MRFRKIIDDPDKNSVLRIIDNESGVEVFTMTGDAILGLVSSIGEHNAKNAIGNIIQDNYYPNLTPEEIQELFS